MSVDILPPEALSVYEEKPDFILYYGLFAEASVLIAHSPPRPTSTPREATKRAIEEWATGWEVLIGEDEFFSCTECRRRGIGPKVRQVIIHCLRDRRILIVWRLDRLTRQPWEVFQEQVKTLARKEGLSLPLYVFPITRPTEETRSEDTRRSLSFLKEEKGVKLGRRTYGPEVDQLIWSLHHRKPKRVSLRNIAAFLNTTKVPTQGGGPWQYQTVASILKRLKKQQASENGLLIHINKVLSKCNQ